MIGIVYQNIALCENKLGHYSEAVVACEQCISYGRGEDSYKVHFFHAEALRQQGMFLAAIRVLYKVALVFPEALQESRRCERQIRSQTQQYAIEKRAVPEVTGVCESPMDGSFQAILVRALITMPTLVKASADPLVVHVIGAREEASCPWNSFLNHVAATYNGRKVRMIFIGPEERSGVNAAHYFPVKYQETSVAEVGAPGLCVLFQPGFGSHLRSWEPALHKALDTGAPCLCTGYQQDHSFVQNEAILQECGARIVSPTKRVSCGESAFGFGRNCHLTIAQGRTSPAPPYHELLKSLLDRGLEIRE